MDGDEYLSDCHITHKGSIPSTSVVKYGFCQGKSINPTDYNSNVVPFIESDEHTFLLTRYNEVMTTIDFKNYVALNGKWQNGAKIEIYGKYEYEENGVIIDSSEYTLNNESGIITFGTIQPTDKNFYLCIYYSNCIRLLCNIENYGDEAASIDHIAFMYNVMKRIPKDDSGNIMHKSIGERI